MQLLFHVQIFHLLCFEIILESRDLGLKVLVLELVDGAILPDSFLEILADGVLEGRLEHGVVVQAFDNRIFVFVHAHVIVFETIVEKLVIESFALVMTRILRLVGLLMDFVLEAL